MNNQYPINARGHRIYPSQVKQEVLQELASGRTASEVGRERGIPIQNILRWKNLSAKASNSDYLSAQPEEMVPLSVHEAQLIDLQKQIKVLRRSLADMTVDRDILKDAVDYATKKKWIVPVSSLKTKNIL